MTFTENFRLDASINNNVRIIIAGDILLLPSDSREKSFLVLFVTWLRHELVPNKDQ
jgi:hypothetical protein